MHSAPEWYCRKCGFREALSSKYYWRCPRCGSPLQILYRKKYETSGKRGLAAFEGLLPLTPAKHLGEGQTPLVQERIEDVNVLFKLEHLNPSGSFKDRGTSLSLSYAREMGYSRAMDDSSGNTAISLSLFAKAYKMEATVIVPRTAPEGKKRLLRLLGAEIREAADRGKAAEEAIKYAEENKDVFYVSHPWSYFYVLGASTIVYEVYEEFGVPDIVVAPVGSGGLLLGLAFGFKTLIELGLTTKMPRLIGVQGYSVQPVSKALRGIELPGEESTLADGIMVPNPPRLNEIVGEIVESQGDVVLVGNTQIKKAWEELIGMGFLVEPTSAAAYAALQAIKQQAAGKTVLLPLTGSGLKFVA